MKRKPFFGISRYFFGISSLGHFETCISRHFENCSLAFQDLVGCKFWLFLVKRIEISDSSQIYGKRYITLFA